MFGDLNCQVFQRRMVQSQVWAQVRVRSGAIGGDSDSLTPSSASRSGRRLLILKTKSREASQQKARSLV